MKFSDIPGHESVKTRLRHMVQSDRIPHALLLEGPEGIGKLALARAFAQYIHCENPTADGDSCGVCRNCRMHQSMNHVDLHYTFPAVKSEGAKSSPISDDFYQEWTDFIGGRVYSDIGAWSATFNRRNANPQIYVEEADDLIHKLAFTGHVARYKLVILWLPERVNETAANKILKLVEEPYEDTIFIMVSNDPKKILPTIYSRLQRITLKRLPDAIVAENLMKRGNMSAEDAMAVAHNANGSMITALEMADSNEEMTTFFDTFVRLMRLAYMRDVKQLREWSEKLAAMTREQQMGFYEYATRMIRENFVLNFGVPTLSYLTSTEHAFAVKFARFITVANVEKLIEVFDKARNDIAGNGNGKIINFDIAIKTILLLKQN